jgi:hypothetical protein
MANTTRNGVTLSKVEVVIGLNFILFMLFIVLIYIFKKAIYTVSIYIWVNNKK